MGYLRANARLNVSTSEYGGPPADYHFDIMSISLPCETWEYIICHRVIEHVPDDRKAMRELYRILKPGGTAIISVPIYRDRTVDYGRANPCEDGHFFAYGLDFEERIPGEFKTTYYRFTELFSRTEFSESALVEDYIFICQKPAS